MEIVASCRVTSRLQQVVFFGVIARETPTREAQFIARPCSTVAPSLKWIKIYAPFWNYYGIVIMSKLLRYKKNKTRSNSKVVTLLCSDIAPSCFIPYSIPSAIYPAPNDCIHSGSFGLKGKLDLIARLHYFHEWR